VKVNTVACSQSWLYSPVKKAPVKISGNAVQDHTRKRFVTFFKLNVLGYFVLLVDKLVRKKMEENGMKAVRSMVLQTVVM
jgi:hypothetical protein